MSEQDTPEVGSPQGESGSASSESPPPAAPRPEAKDSNRGLMIVLSYLWILFLVPLLVEKEDSEVQWHAKHGLVLTVLEILVQLVLNVITVTGIGCIFAVFIPLVFLGFAIIRLVCIVKGLAGERFLIPGVSQYADRF